MTAYFFITDGPRQSYPFEPVFMRPAACMVSHAHALAHVYGKRIYEDQFPEQLTNLCAAVAECAARALERNMERLSISWEFGGKAGSMECSGHELKDLVQIVTPAQLTLCLPILSAFIAYRFPDQAGEKK